MPRIFSLQAFGQACLVAALLFGAAMANAQSNPVGLWRNIDDNTGQPRAEIRITDNRACSALESSAAWRLTPPRNRPIAGTDDRKDQPIIGMETVRGARRAADSDWWEGGQILDPDNGKTYALRLRVNDDGKTLLVRGYIGPFYRTQTWVRAQ